MTNEIQCENTVLSSSAFWLAGERKSERCSFKAKWIVAVNPPTEERDGKVRLCDHCNRFDYITFPREKLNEIDSADRRSV